MNLQSMYSGKNLVRIIFQNFQLMIDISNNVSLKSGIVPLDSCIKFMYYF